MLALATIDPLSARQLTVTASMTFNHLLQILVLAIVQGLAELLPVSSSAHVTIAGRLMHFDMSRVYEWTFLLVMLHTGTMFSVLIYFWSRWKKLINQIPSLITATFCTGVIGYPLMLLLKKLFLNADPTAQPQEIEQLFLNLPLMACALASVGVLIIIAGLKDEKSPATLESVDLKRAALIGATQGLALPFRGFSRSGSTISAAILSGVARIKAEEFSFALAVIITPVVIAREVWMLIKEHGQAATDAAAGAPSLSQLLLPGLLGMLFSFLAGLVALRWLSNWLEHGRWQFFGIYCLFAAAVVLVVHYYR
jgi:undecaprenyl-diphosphatase